MAAICDIPRKDKNPTERGGSEHLSEIESLKFRRPLHDYVKATLRNTITIMPLSFAR